MLNHIMGGFEVRDVMRNIWGISSLVVKSFGSLGVFLECSTFFLHLSITQAPPNTQCNGCVYVCVCLCVCVLVQTYVC